MELRLEGQELYVRVVGRPDPDALRRSILDVVHAHPVKAVRVRIEEPSKTAVCIVAETVASQNLPVSWTL